MKESSACPSHYRDLSFKQSCFINNFYSHTNSLTNGCRYVTLKFMSVFDKHSKLVLRLD